MAERSYRYPYRRYEATIEVTNAQTEVSPADFGFEDGSAGDSWRLMIAPAVAGSEDILINSTSGDTTNYETILTADNKRWDSGVDCTLGTSFYVWHGGTSPDDDFDVLFVAYVPTRRAL